MEKALSVRRVELAWRKLRWSVTQRGVRGTMKVSGAAVRRGLLGRRREPVQAHPWDAENGVETSGLLGGGSLAVGHRHDAYIVGYAGVPPSRFRAVLERWQGTLENSTLENYGFVDLGCGKGRALLLASEYPFREALGVELNAELVSVAQRNVGIWTGAGRARCPIRILEADATEVTLPSGPLLVFIYNSFAAPVTRGVMHRLAMRACSGDNRIDVIYQNEGDEVPLRTDPRLNLTWRAVIPMSEPDAAADPAASPMDPTGAYRWKV